MFLDNEQCYRALRSHDSRFDGRFFVGVATTRIYCRPVCTARTPNRQNCRFFPSAAAAEGQGFRPCLRCRPELAPGYAVVDANRRLAQAAAGMIEDGRLGEARLPELAQALGVTDRHLRRVFQQEFGVAPVEYAQTQRLLLAKRLLTDTSMSVLDVAMASGFASLRRFNHLFRTRYRMTPAELRGSAPDRGTPEKLTFELGYRPPYDWDSMLAFLERRSIPGVDCIEKRGYERTLRIVRDGREHAGVVRVEQARKRAALSVTLSASLAAVLPAALARMKHLFDLASHPDEVATGLGELAREYPGLRLPGAADGFEIAVRAVLGQQVTVKAAATLAARFVAKFGQPLPMEHPRLSALFPLPGAVAKLSVGDIASLGIISSRAKAIIALATEIDAGRLSLHPSASVEGTVAKLEEIPGIGKWTAQYIAMRALAWPDAFPHPDVAVLKALGPLTPAKALQAVERFRPWRAYAVLHLWKSLENKP